MSSITDPAVAGRAPLEPVTERKRYDLSLAEHDYPDWEGRPTRTILLCSEQRSGSTLLGEILYFAGDLGCPLEYFHRGFGPDFMKRWQASESEAFLRAAYRHRTAPNGTFSAKLFWTDLLGMLAVRDAALHAQITAAPPALLGPAPDLYRAIAVAVGDLLEGATYVHLRRLDRVRRAVSGIVAEETGLWRSIPGVGEHRPRSEPVYDFDRIANRVAASDQAHAHWTNLFAAIAVTPISLTYEELTRDYRGTATRVLRALGSDATPVTPRMQRQSDRRSEDYALRYLREAQARLAASGNNA
jgi:LPS sulfotransferase NodH